MPYAGPSSRALPIDWAGGLAEAAWSLARGLQRTSHYTADAMVEDLDGMVPQAWVRTLLAPAMSSRRAADQDREPDGHGHHIASYVPDVPRHPPRTTGTRRPP